MNYFFVRRRKYLLILVLSFFFNTFTTNAQLVESDSIPKTAEIADVGIYLMNIYDMDFSTNSFYADFYVWAKWKGENNPLENLEFVNYIEKWGLTKEYLFDTVQVFDNGTKYNVLRIEGRFFQKFSLKQYPIDKQTLQIEIENSIYTFEELVYRPLKNESGISDKMHLPGWIIGENYFQANINKYKTNFGDDRKVKNESYSNLSYNLPIKRPLNYFLWKLMLPLLVVLITSLGATFIFPGYIDARIYMPIGGLLTAVFLQQSYSDALPDVGYLVLMDKIYVLSYIIIILNIIQAIITANWVSTENEADIKRVNKFDYKFAIFSILTFSIFSLFIIFTT